MDPITNYDAEAERQAARDFVLDWTKQWNQEIAATNVYVVTVLKVRPLAKFCKTYQCHYRNGVAVMDPATYFMWSLLANPHTAKYREQITKGEMRDFSFLAYTGEYAFKRLIQQGYIRPRKEAE